MNAMDPREQAVYDVLGRLGIHYERFEHPPVATVDEAVRHWAGIEAVHCKNLFLRNKKGDRHYLVVAGHRTPVDLRRLAALVGDDRLSFGSPERLQAHLGLTPGAVSPFGLINDREHRVQVVIDAALREAERVAFHPNVNTATIVLARQDFEKFLAWSGHTVRYLALSADPPIRGSADPEA
jgi:Ala-tRNA(Pro) deacylase